MKAGQKFTCVCGKSVVAVVRTPKGGVRQLVAADHFKPDNRTWCGNSGRAI